jgi:hypothetical protein
VLTFKNSNIAEETRHFVVHSPLNHAAIRSFLLHFTVTVKLCSKSVAFNYMEQQPQNVIYVYIW